MSDKITDLAAWRAAHAKPITDACRCHAKAIETVLTTNLRIAFAWQRTALRAMGLR